MSTPHKRIPPGQQGACPTNTTSWTDPVIQENATNVRTVHINELRSSANQERSRRGFSQVSFTDDPLQPNSVNIRKVHIDELRQAIYTIQNPPGYPPNSCPTNQDTCVCETHKIVYTYYQGSPAEYCSFCQDYCKTNVKGYCASDNSTRIQWTDPNIVAGQTPVRKPHIVEARNFLNEQRQQCVCEAERCSYCADCGHSYQWITWQGCWCDDHKYNECMRSETWYHICKTADADTSDFEQALQQNLPPGINSGDQVPWNCMCNFTPPGSGWNVTRRGYNRQATWGCMCNPFRWLGGNS